MALGGTLRLSEGLIRGLSWKQGCVDGLFRGHSRKQECGDGLFRGQATKSPNQKAIWGGFEASPRNRESPTWPGRSRFHSYRWRAARPSQQATKSPNQKAIWGVSKPAPEIGRHAFTLVGGAPRGIATGL